MNLYLELEALTDLSLSTGNQSFGQVDSHDYIPGRTLWGAIASAFYRAGLPEDTAFRLFHQGALRISDGVPLVDGHRCYPSPASWHQPKERPDGTLKNFVSAAARHKAREIQHIARPVGWVTADGKAVSLGKNYSLRTAVDATGKARDGLLYGLAVIEAGTLFSARVDAAEDDLAHVRKFLDDAELHLGRSRNAELGLVKVRLGGPPRALPHGSGKTETISVLCVSRCVFRDQKTGAPSLVPAGRDLGLPEEWQLDRARTFLRSTRVVHFHSKRTRPEPERFALEKGSVLTFSGPGVNIDDVLAKATAGVGEFVSQGYGEVLIAPDWLTREDMKLGEIREPEEQNLTLPSDELFEWAQRRAYERRQALSLYERAGEDARVFRTFSLPGAQWGTIRAMAREARFSGDGQLLDRLLGPNGYLRDGKRRLSGGWKRALPELEAACRDKDGHLAVYLEFLASACMRPDDTPTKGVAK